MMWRWFYWLFVRPWPIWTLAVISLVVAYFGTWTVSGASPGFNKIAGAILQALGALLVLISLDGNVGLFKGRGLIAEIMLWARDYPRKPHTIYLEATGCSQGNSSTGGVVTVRPTTIDQRIAELERVVVELRTLILKGHGELTDAIAAARVEAKNANNQTALAVRSLESKLVVSAVGGVKVQAFGVGLALLGSVLSVFS
jgi:hypothetical protein